MRLSSRFNDEPAVKLLAAQFVLLKVATDDDETWGQWNGKYPAAGDGIPKVFVVRADGKLLYAKSGTPDPLPAFLSAGLNESGKFLSEKQLEQLAKTVAEVRKLVEKEDVPLAVQKLSRVLDSQSFAEPAVLAQQLAAEMTERATKALTDAEAQLADSQTTFEGVLAIVEIERTYVLLPAMRKPITFAVTALKKDRVKRDFYSQAEALDKANLLASQKKAESALAAYRTLETRFPNTRVAELASAKAKELEANGVTVKTVPTSTEATKATSSSKKSSSAKAATGKDDEKRAASQLRIAKLYLKSNPDKARDYLQQVVDLVPDSALAREASELLKQLEK